MPTTTEAPAAGTVAATAAAALLAWTAIAAAMAAAVPQERVVALGNPAALLASPGTAYLSAGRGYAVVRPDDAAASRALYGAGAWIVLPFPAGGCLGIAR